MPVKMDMQENFTIRCLMSTFRLPAPFFSVLYWPYFTLPWRSKAVKNAILRGIPYAEENVIDMIYAEMEKVAEALEDEHQQV